jgi:uncharacterized protein (DUF3084 family)
MLGGISFIVGFVLVAGLVAYIGDRVGHQVGRRRLTLFGLRPKYTSTIVAVATGMLIALSVNLAGLLLSSVFRNAVFRLGAVNAEITDLQSQAVALRKEVDMTRNGNLQLPVLYPIAGIVLTLVPNQPDDVLLPRLSELFDRTVESANREYTHPPYALKPYKHKSSEPEIQADLKRELMNIREDLANHNYPADAPVLLAPVVGQNLFAGDTISFSFEHYVDKRIAAAGETLAEVRVEGGSAIDIVTMQRLQSLAAAQLIKRGFPPFFVGNVQTNTSQAQLNLLPHLRGKYELVAKSSIDTYPHTRGYIIDVSLVPQS